VIIKVFTEMHVQWFAYSIRDIRTTFTGNVIDIVSQIMKILIMSCIDILTTGHVVGFENNLIHSHPFNFHIP